VTTHGGRTDPDPGEWSRSPLDERYLLAVVTGALVILQVYLPVYGRFEITLWQALLALSLPAALVLGLPPAAAFRQPPAVGVAALIIGCLAVAPTAAGGEPAVRTAVFLAIGGAAYLLGYRIGVGGRTPTLLRAFMLVGLPFAALNVVFFLLPRAELAFLQSGVALVLVEPNTLRGLFRAGLGNNVLAPGKAGTLFVNTNVASILFGFGTCVGVYRLGRRPSTGRAAAAGLMLLAFLATGSRAGITAATGTALIVGSLAAWRLGATRPLKWMGVGILVALVALSLPMSRQPLLRLVAASSTGDPRLFLWAHAAGLIAEHPLTGVGFHGWEQSFAPYARAIGLDPTLPPHNAYLMAWLWLGLAGLATMALIIGGTLLSCARLTGRRWLVDIGLLGVALASWFGIQLFFTNFALLEPRVGGAFFLLVGAIYGAAEYRRLQGVKASSRVQELVPAALGSVDVQQSGGAAAL